MTENKSKIGILGYGETGKAIAKFYKNPRLRQRFGGQAKIKDLDRNDGLAGVKILNVCIPWSEKFVNIVKKEITEIEPELVIIHSTIAPGTTKKINMSLPKKWAGKVVHSPIRGIHPHLFEGIKTFVKYIGADNKKAGRLAKRHLESLGIKTKICSSSLTTEIGKLLDTSYYGLCIAWHGEMDKLCRKFKIDFEKAVTDFNKTYNEGYEKLNKPNVIRPVLYPPKAGIGGHCICANAEILKKYFNSQALDLILSFKNG